MTEDKAVGDPPNNRNKQNILISYTKWLFKWFIIIVLVIGTIGIGIWGVIEFIDSKVDMFAIECESNFGNQDLDEYTKKRFYLVKKKRFEDKPFALYRPPYREGSGITKNTKINETFFQYSLTYQNDKFYEFGAPNKKDRTGHIINRKNGEVVFHNGYEKKDKKQPLDNCRIISTKNFYERSGQVLEKMKLDIRL